MASVVSDKWQSRLLFILKQAFAMDFANEGSDIKKHYVIV